jgi:dihydrofolate reductase
VNEWRPQVRLVWVPVSQRPDCVVERLHSIVRALIEHDLVDELRLMVYPVVAGTGKRLFDDISDTKRLRLVGTRTVGDSLASLTYDLDGAAY